ncbi:hypothetical protein M8C21_014083 [Ambrosia artemisiifolia]|uniref:Uncharacterized protein n=1 Tax=Ambrosia artemisiifolia TaxID=4212 RepID=A0AAD5GG38_AMBAR|nr:hypothetical protein M8C21_014083 [Ambrosia artemisiifolia]
MMVNGGDWIRFVAAVAGSESSKAERAMDTIIVSKPFSTAHCLCYLSRTSVPPLFRPLPLLTLYARHIIFEIDHKTGKLIEVYLWSWAESGKGELQTKHFSLQVGTRHKFKIVFLQWQSMIRSIFFTRWGPWHIVSTLPDRSKIIKSLMKKVAPTAAAERFVTLELMFVINIMFVSKTLWCKKQSSAAMRGVQLLVI